MTSLAEQGVFADTQEKKRRVYHLWKKGQATQEEYRVLIMSCREEIRKATSQLELRLANVVRDNKKCFYKYINDLQHHVDTYKSMGLDGIHPRVLRELAEELAKPLPIIYQQSWLAGEVPDDWRITSVTLTYKKGWKENPGNYRPVSLTLVLGKIMEQFILSALTGHVKGSGPASLGS